MIPIQLLGLRHDMTHLSSSSDQRQSVNAGTGPTSSSSHAISHPQSSSGSPSDRIRQSSSSSSGWLRSPTGVRTAMTTSTSQPFESLKDGISTGMNFLKRRFSTDQEEPAMDAPTTVQAGSTAAGPPPAGYAAQTTPGADQGFSLTGIASKVSATISAPTSPAKQQSGQSSMYSQVQGLTKNLFQAATGTGPTRPAYNKDKCKCVLVIDDQHADWSKYFRGKKILNEYDIRVEQAEFSEISLSSYSDSGCLVDMEINRGAGKVSRSFQPDFVIIRQPVRTATQDYSNIVIGLTFGGVSALNSLDSVYNFLNKPWVFGHLLRIQHKVGKDSFPLIDQAFYATLKEITSTPQFPVVVKMGRGHKGLGKIKVNDAMQLADVSSVTAVTGECATVEPFIDSKYDVHVQKIGPSYKAFIRKGITGQWKTNTGSSMLEQVAMTDRYKLWVDEVAKLFGGLDICAVEALVGKDGREVIYEANDCAFTLLGETQEDDRRLMAELALQKMNAIIGGVQSAQKKRNSIDSRAPENFIKHETPAYQNQARIPPQQTPNVPTAPLQTSNRPPPSQPRPAAAAAAPMQPPPAAPPAQGPPSVPSSAPGRGPPPPRPTRQPSLPRQTSGESQAAAVNAQVQPQPPAARTAVPQDDTMGQLKKTFAGIFGDM